MGSNQKVSSFGQVLLRKQQSDLPESILFLHGCVDHLILFEMQNDNFV